MVNLESQPCESSVILNKSTGTLWNELEYRLSTESGVLLTVLCFAGIVCNSLSIAVLRRRNSLGTRLLLYLSYVGVVFTTLTYCYIVLPYILPHGRDTVIASGYLEPFLYPLLWTIYSAEVYLIVLIGVQRALVLSVPLRFIRFTRDDVLQRVLIGVAVFCVLVNIPVWVSTLPQFYWNADVNTTLIIEVEVFPEEKFMSFKISFDNILPLITILVCDGFMFVSKWQPVPGVGQEKRWRRRNHLTNIVIAVTTMSVMLNIVVTSLYVVVYFELSVPVLVKKYLNVAFAALVFSNSSINFLFFCLFGPGFRETLVCLFKRRQTRPTDHEQVMEMNMLETEK